MEEPRPVRRRARAFATGGSLAVIVACWILLTPPGAAPDEPGHVVRAGAVVRGDLDGDPLFDLGLEVYDLPDSYVVPEPACYAFQPTIAVDCAPPTESSGATVALASRADDYPIWGHLTYGVPTLLPGVAPIWWARAFGAAIAVTLLAAALLCARGRQPLAAAGVIAATTPMAWSTIAVVNPSSFGIAGATALWVSLLDERRSAAWLTAAGWVALSLPRRDGLLWACTILAVVLVAQGRSLGTWWRGLGIGPQLLIAAATIATAVWGVTNDTRVSRMVVLSPLVVVAVDGWRWLWQRLDRRSERIGVAGGTALVATLAAIVLLRARPGGWDTELARAVVGQTGNHLIEAVGVLGWLDTSLPTLAVVGWTATIGILAAVAAASSPRLFLVAVAVLTILVLASWVLELFQGNTSGQYWQGRYSLPLLAGVPIVLATATAPAAAGRRIAWAVGGTALALVNVAAWAAARRWGVGIEGPLAPWSWDTHLHPIPPVVTLAVHAIATGALAVVVFGGPDQPQRLTPSASNT